MDEEALRITFVSSDRGLGEAFARALGTGFVLRTESSIRPEQSEGFACADVLLLDLRPTNLSSEEQQLDLLERVCGVFGNPPVLVLCDTDNRDFVLKATSVGAADCVANPPNIVELRILLRRAYRVFSAERELERYRVLAAHNGQLHDLLGSSPSMVELFAMVGRVGPCDVNVHITGETGTGKELLARAIHRTSPRSNGPWVAFSCANLPESLVEDELFGHERGAFTGAIQLRQGRIEAANHGTLFLDEIGDMGLGLQPKLLRVLQEKSFERIGGNKTIALDTRVICATNRSLKEMVAQGQFREDLYYRLNVVELHLPPLRERSDDIPLLARHFVRKSADRFHKKELRISAAAMRCLEQYQWPGNVRELENVIQRAMVMADEEALDLSHLPRALHAASGETVAVASEATSPAASATDEEFHVEDHFAPPMNSSYEQQMREFKRNLILRTLRQNEWRKADTARALGMARGYLHRLINQLDIREDAEPKPISSVAAVGSAIKKETRSLLRPTELLKQAAV